MNLWEFASKRNLMIIIGLIILILTILELWLSRKINRNARKIVFKYPQDRIIALLSEHGGKMSRVDISNYLDWPMDLVMRVLLEMEKEEIISRGGGSGEFIILKKPGS